MLPYTPLHTKMLPLKQPRLPLLPVPEPEAVDRFIGFYHDRFGVNLDWPQAHQMLTGLMRLVYLTDKNSGGRNPTLEGLTTLH